jgi:hypothetical protein
MGEALIPAAAVLLISAWKPTPTKTKAQLREMLAQAARNTQPQPETKPNPKPLLKAKKGRGPNGTHWAFFLSQWQSSDF